MRATCPKGEWGASNTVRDYVLNRSCACAFKYYLLGGCLGVGTALKRRLTKIKTNPTYLPINTGGWRFMEGDTWPPPWWYPEVCSCRVPRLMGLVALNLDMAEVETHWPSFEPLHRQVCRAGTSR